MKLNLSAKPGSGMGILTTGKGGKRGRSKSRGNQRKGIELKTPRSIDKHKKNMQGKLKKAMEENVRHKMELNLLQEQN